MGEGFYNMSSIGNGSEMERALRRANSSTSDTTGTQDLCDLFSISHISSPSYSLPRAVSGDGCEAAESMKGIKEKLFLMTDPELKTIGHLESLIDRLQGLGLNVPRKELDELLRGTETDFNQVTDYLFCYLEGSNLRQTDNVKYRKCLMQINARHFYQESSNQPAAVPAPAPVPDSASTHSSPVKRITAKPRRARSPRPDGCQRGRSQSPNPDRQRGRSRDRSKGRHGDCSNGNNRGSKTWQGPMDEYKALRPREKLQVDEWVKFFKSKENPAKMKQTNAKYIAKSDGFASQGYRDDYHILASALKAAKAQWKEEAKDGPYRS